MVQGSKGLTMTTHRLSKLKFPQQYQRNLKIRLDLRQFVIGLSTSSRRLWVLREQRSSISMHVVEQFGSDSVEVFECGFCMPLSARRL